MIVIDREKALSHPFANGKYDKKHANLDFILGFESYKEWLESLPTIEAKEDEEGHVHCHVCGGDKMGRLIDVDKLHWFKCTTLSGEEYVLLPFKSITDIPTVEALSKDEVVDLLTELQNKIADNVESIVGHYDASTPERKRPMCKSARNEGRTECIDLIQEKIDELRSNSDGKGVNYISLEERKEV